MKIVKGIFCLVLLGFCACAMGQRAKYNFNSNWKVFVGDATGAEAPEFDDASWKAVALPYAWNEDDAFRKDIRELSTGIAWYRKKFKLPVTARGRKVFLEFEGIRQAGDFYVNGRHIGIHENGVTAFGFDVTDLVKFGEENVVAARIDNDWDYKERATGQKYQWEDRNFNSNYGGITKNVFLHITNKVYQTLPLFTHLNTTGVYIYATDHNIKGKSAVIHAESEVKNESDEAREVSYEVVITDLNNKPVKTFSGGKTVIPAGGIKTVKAASLVNNLLFWSWGYGYLYNVQTVLKVGGQPVDAVSTRTGFRKTAFKDGMIYLNDRVILVHGYAQRTTNEWPSVGASVPAWLSDYSNGLMVKSNGNLVRWMHITPWKQDIESCDRVGLMQAMPAGDAEADVTGVRWEQRKAVMRDAIIYGKNNPSIIFYECGNENISEQHMQEMKAIRDQYDPNGGRAIGSREMLDSKVAEWGGEMLYTNKSADIPLWATEYSRDEGLRKYWDEFTPPYHKDGDGPLHNGQNASAYNRNMESHAVENVKRWYEFWRERPGMGRRVSSGGVNIIFSETNTHHRGAENYRRSGEVDALRIIKENYYAHKVMWDGWVEPERPGIHIIGHWNYKQGVKKDIYVISSAERVELKVNGRSLGFGNRSDGFLFTFKNVSWSPGTISAIGYNDGGRQICTTQKITTGPPVALRLTNIRNPRGFMADGHDLALIEVEVVDAKGSRVPTALNMINFQMTGPAVWRGGMAQGPDNYTLTQTYPVEGGVNRALIRSTTQPGTIVIKASSEGLKDATLTLTTKPFPSENGLSKILPSDGLPVNLERGPTPLTPSFKVHRIAVPIVKATAGANADTAYASFDDNERTDWVNDGNLSTAWIEYELEREATVSEVALKLNNFRSRTYPLRITVDDKEVFADTTQRSLGYVTLVCKPQRGKKVRIQLATLSKDAAGNQMVEVSGKKLDDGVARDDSKATGTLSIIEAEIYEAVSYDRAQRPLSNSGKANKPNIIFILADDLGYGDVGCYGQQKIETPNIDRLATLGVRFTQVYSGSTVCAPARSSFMTGLHTGHTAVRGNRIALKPEGQVPLPDSVITFPMLLQEAGYTTAAFGKWALGFITSSGDPQKKGFHEFYGYNCQSLAHNYYPDHLWHNHERIDLPGNLRSDSAYSADLIHAQAISFLKTEHNRPFFLYLPYTLPHAELMVPHDDVYNYYVKKFNEDPAPAPKATGDAKVHFESRPHAAFAAMVSRLDKYVGEIINLLKEKGIEENTLVIFTSDNGPHKEKGGDPAFFNSNGNLRGIKRDLYEGGIRVPFIAYQKGFTKAGTVNTMPAALWDMYPTFLEMAGWPGTKGIDGISLIRALKGEKQRQHNYFYWELHESGGRQAVRLGNWKGVRLNVTTTADAPIELYDLGSDPQEKNNVASKHPEIVKQIAQIMQKEHVPANDWPLMLNEVKK